VIISGRKVTANESNKKMLYFPPHLTTASVLSGETRNPEIASFHLNAAYLFTKNTQNTIKISPNHS